MEKLQGQKLGNSSVLISHARPFDMVPLCANNQDHQAMKYLSRTWSPSSSDFFQILSSSALSSPKELGMINCADETEDDSSSNSTPVVSAENIWVWLSSNGRGTFRHKSIQRNWMGIVKSWLTRDTISSGHIRRKKEQCRLQTAEIHAALSVTQLAAAIAGFVAQDGLDNQPILLHNRRSCTSSSCADQGDMWRKNMSLAMASAAALVATVCAEAAESVGATRTRITSVIDSGLAIRTANEMDSLTATAATCLRGAAALRSRNARYVLEYEELLASGAQLAVCTPTGKTGKRNVRVFLKGKQLILKLRKERLWGALITTCKEYKIMDAREGCITPNGVSSLSLSTNGGSISLLFEDEQQLNIWRCSISCILASLRSNGHDANP